jgi:hypothetical protein
MLTTIHLFIPNKSVDEALFKYEKIQDVVYAKLPSFPHQGQNTEIDAIITYLNDELECSNIMKESIRLILQDDMHHYYYVKDFHHMNFPVLDWDIYFFGHCYYDSFLYYVYHGEDRYPLDFYAIRLLTCRLQSSTHLTLIYDYNKYLLSKIAFVVVISFLILILLMNDWNHHRIISQLIDSMTCPII